MAASKSLTKAEIAQALADPNATITLQEPRTNGLWLTLGSFVFVGPGLVMLNANDWRDPLMWGCVIFFGFCMAIGLMQLFGPKGTLRLSPIGYEAVTLGRTHTETWNDIAVIDVTRVQTRKMVVFDYTQAKLDASTPMLNKGAALSKSLCGFHGGLPSGYGQKHKDLADAMELRRFRADAHSSP
jgi:hypothetical protein